MKSGLLVSDIKAICVVSHRETWIEIFGLNGSFSTSLSSLTERRGLKSFPVKNASCSAMSSLTERRGLKYVETLLALLLPCRLSQRDVD